MRKIIITFFSFFIFYTLTLSAAAQSGDFVTIYAWHEKDDHPIITGHCSGIALKDGWVLTIAHFFKSTSFTEGDNITIVHPGKEVAEGITIAGAQADVNYFIPKEYKNIPHGYPSRDAMLEDFKNDIGLVKVPGLECSTERRLAIPPAKKDALLIYNTPETETEITTLKPQQDGAKTLNKQNFSFMLYDIVLMNSCINCLFIGDSGSTLLDKKGNIVGVFSGIYKDSFLLFTPINYDNFKFLNQTIKNNK